MIDKEFIKEKINLITRDLEQLEIFANFALGEIAEDFMKFSALKNIFVEIIGRAIDINEHIIAEMAEAKKIEAPKTYKETFILLADLGVLPKNFAEEISKSAGFRNAIVHEYNNLDKSFIYKKIGDAIRQYAEYCNYILRFLNENNC
jgi:uncharacterized protein YutE (UPF0331/DUF86 family)